MNSAKINLLIQSIHTKVLDKFGMVAFKKMADHAYLDRKKFYEKKPNHSYLKAGTFIEARQGYSYVPDYYRSTQHKLVDIRTLPKFGALAKEVIDQGRTLLGYDRLYTVYQSLESLKRFTVGTESINLAEIGVYKGGTSHFIALCARALDLNAVLHSFDTFEGHADIDIEPGTDNELIHKPGLFNDLDITQVRDYLRQFPNIVLYKGRFQDNSIRIEQQQFRFVHLDVDLHAPTLYALNFMRSRLASKGLIVIDDYGNTNCPGVVQAVAEFAELNRDFTILGLLTGQCILIKD